MRQAQAACAEVPQFDRLRYFYGQMLHARDLQLEQAYFREKLKLHNRCLHGWGVVCGLEVTPPPADPDCVPVTDAKYTALTAEIEKLEKAVKDATGAARDEYQAHLEKVRLQRTALGPPSDCTPADPRTRAQIACGLAIDCEGNELVVRQPLTVDLWSAMTPDQRRRVEPTEATTLYLGICYRECPIDPVRPVVADVCGATADCTFGKLRDSVSVVVTTDGERWTDDRCEPCCGPADGDCCVLLARIEDFVKGQPLEPDQIRLEARRALSLRPSTRITGINWVHGGTYSPAQASTLLGDASAGSGGLEIRFSRAVRSETLVDGIVDTWVLEGGGGRAAAISNKAGLLVQPTTPTTDRLIYRDDTSEVLNNGDRVLVILRSAFVLDDCCRPVDGAHIGGRVPLLHDSPPALDTPKPAECLGPPGGVGPWTSGAGGATNFESWFRIRRP